VYYEYIQNSEKRPLYPGTVQFSTESEAAIDGGGTKRANETVTKRLLNRNCQWERTCEPNGTMAGDPVGRHLRAQRVTHHTLPRAPGAPVRAPTEQTSCTPVCEDELESGSQPAASSRKRRRRAAHLVTSLSPSNRQHRSALQTQASSVRSALVTSLSQAARFLPRDLSLNAHCFSDLRRSLQQRNTHQRTPRGGEHRA
jgi:hypothetical protein